MHLAPAGKARLLASLGAAILAVSAFLQWWQIGGSAGELASRSDVGISDGRVFLMFLAAVAVLLVATLPIASRRPTSIDRFSVYLALAVVAGLGFATRAADLAGHGLLPWPATRGAGFWFAGVGIVVLAAGVLAVLVTSPGKAQADDSEEDDEDGASLDAPVIGEVAVGKPDPEADGTLDLGDRPLYVPEWLMRCWRWLSRSPSLPDRSGSLDSEPRGRLDRLDLWVVAALIVAVVSMRVFDLGQPTQMYFDEVYHARSATEFLQEWRYEIPHDIYEWTHPMLAKYAIAGGISLFSDDKVTGSGDLGVPVVKDAVVQVRTATSPGSLTPPDPNADADYNAYYGDRAFVATGSEVRAYDLQTRALVHAYSIPGAAALSQPTADGMVYVGTSNGRIYRIDTNSLDDLRAGRTSVVKEPALLGVDTGLSIAHIYAGTPPYILVSDAGGTVESVDMSTSSDQITGRSIIPGAADFAALGSSPATVTANSAEVTDPKVEAQILANIADVSDVASIQTAMSGPHGLEVTLPLLTLTPDQAASISAQISAGALPGIHVEAADPDVLVACQAGVAIVDAHDLVTRSTLSLGAPATSIALDPGQMGDSTNSFYRFYVAAGSSILLVDMPAVVQPTAVSLEGSQPLEKMPGAVTKVVFDYATRIVQVLGRTPDGKGWTVYAVETNGNAVFSDAQLPSQPVAIGLDNATQVKGFNQVRQMPEADREALLAFGPDGSMVTVDVGQFAFSWRIIGVLFGALMAVCLYLLARLLFRRRTVGVLIAFFSLVDGMLFVQSRIAMNDTYVGGFLLLAYLIFAVMWLGVWKNRLTFWLGMPLLGLVLGLALASKWVALYAIASIGLLILIRSALGRLIAVLGLAVGTGVLGWMAIAEMQYQPGTGSPLCVVMVVGAVAVVAAGTIVVIRTRLVPDRVMVGVVTAAIAGVLLAGALLLSPGTIDNGAPNYTFFVIMLAVTVLAAAGNAYRPVAWTREEFYFAVGAPPVLGVIAPFVAAILVVPIGFSPDMMTLGRLALEGGLGGAALGLGAGAAFWVAGLVGFGPLAALPEPGSARAVAGPPSPAPDGWLRLGSGFGIPAAWTVLCVAVLPFVIYVLMYVPWAMPWQPQTQATGALPVIACWHVDTTSGMCDNAWPAGHTGQTLWDLTNQMYAYHDDLRASHPASSPWWAWPLDLKPVWFDSGSDVPSMFSWIYDAGNPALWWMAVFGIGFVSWQAMRRRSLGLGLIAVAFFWQWLSWARIDRATFQYHFYTALPFFLMALAYFLAELWHGPSRRTWLLARVAGAVALLTPGLLWLLKPELCGLARVDPTGYYQSTVCGGATGDVVVTTRVFLISAVLGASLLALGLILWRLERRRSRGEEDRAWLLQLLAPVAVSILLTLLMGAVGSEDVLLRLALPADTLTFFPVVIGIVTAYFAVTARNPRRFVMGFCVIAAILFVFLYPDLSALWMPATIQGIYSVLSPTWMYGFFFSTNLQVSTPVKVVSLSTAEAVVAALFVAGVAAWAAWERRYYVASRKARLLGPEDGPDPDAGPSELT